MQLALFARRAGSKLSLPSDGKFGKVGVAEGKCNSISPVKNKQKHTV